MPFYSYSFTVTDDGSVYYSFSTKTGTGYRVYFYPAADYSDYVLNYPELSNHGYIFGFTKVEPDEDKAENMDLRIKDTIRLVVLDFMNLQKNLAVLLCHCDYYDGKQSKRMRLFKQWYDEGRKASMIFMEESEISTLDENGNVSSRNFLGYLIAENNPGKVHIANAFQAIREDLAKEK